MDEQDRAEVLQQREQWKEAFKARDIDRLMPYYTEDNVTYDLNPPLQFATPDARHKNWEAFLGRSTET